MMTTDAIQPVAQRQTKNLKKPDDAAHKKFLEDLNKKIDALKKEQDAVKLKIEKLGKSDPSRREELIAQLNEIRDKQSDIKKSKKSVYEQLDALNDSIRKKVGEVKSFQTKVPFKNAEDVDQRVRDLESQIERGVRLVEEKKILQEISTLKRGRAQVEDVNEQQVAIDKEREIYNELRKNVDDGESKRLSDKYETLNAELQAIFDDSNKQREERTKLYNERTRIKEALDEAYNTLRTSRDEHRKANDEYYVAVREAREKKKEAIRLEKVAMDHEKRQGQYREALEVAAMPAYENILILCDNLVHSLEVFTGKSNDAVDDNQAANLEVTMTDAPEGFVIKKKDLDEVYFMGGNNKKKNSPKTPKVKKSDTLTLPLSTVDDFFEVKVTVPTKISEIPATIEMLKERKAYYEREQPKVTEANIKKAQEKIAAMEAAYKVEMEADLEPVKFDDDDE